MEQINIENILFIDIETVANEHNYNNLDNRLKDLWTKKVQYKIEKENKTAEQLYDSAGIWAEFGKIVCISVGYIKNINKKQKLRLKSFYSHNEKKLLNDFTDLLNKHFNKKKYLLCAHNGKEFDFPYIARRMLINNIKIPNILNISGKKPWEIKHIDTLDMWKFGDFKHYTSLDLLAALFNIPSPKNQIDGSMVNDIYWKENDLNRIVEYCQKDVITVCNVFLKLKNINIIKDEDIDIIKE